MGNDGLSRKILYITGTRADYGLMRSVLKAINERPELELALVATGMHFMDEFGRTIDEVRADGYPLHEMDIVYESDTKQAMVRFIGKCVLGLSDLIPKIDPDIILLLGDRGEMLAGAIAGAYLSIPVAHIHGGEITSTVDDIVRHAITKLSTIHLPATRESAGRICRMGEDPSRVHVVGAPGLDAIVEREITSPEKIFSTYHLDPKKPILLVVQHPVTLEVEQSGDQMRETMEAAKDLGYQTIVIYPNADAGGRRMIDVLQEYTPYPNFIMARNIPHDDYLGLMKVSSVLIGNSSSGIIEAPSFHLPVVNIGNRQLGRERGENVIDVAHDRKAIKEAILKALFDEDFRAVVGSGKNPYGDGNAGVRIARILSEFPLDTGLTQKRLTFSLHDHRSK